MEKMEKQEKAAQVALRSRLRRVLDLRYQIRENEQAFIESKARSSLRSLAFAMFFCAAVVAVKAFPQSAEDIEIGMAFPVGCFLIACLTIGGIALWTLGCGHMRGHELLWLAAVLSLSFFLFSIDIFNPLMLSLGERMQVTTVTLVGLATMSPIRFHFLCCAVFIITLCRSLGYVMLFLPIAPITSGLQPFQPITCALHSFMVLQLLVAAWWIETYERKDWLQVRQLQETKSELSGVANTAAGMAALVERLCDLVIWLNADQRVCDNSVIHLSFFGRNIYGEPFHSVLAQADKERFKKSMQLASSSQVSQLIPVTILRQGSTIEGHILVVDTGSSSRRYLVGVLAEVPLNELKEGGPPMRVRLDLAADPAAPGGDLQSVVTGASTRLDSTGTGQAFKQLNLQRILDLGISEHWVLDRWQLQVSRPARILGVGGFGLVLAAQLHGKCVAVKVPRKRESNQPLRDLCNELRVLRHVRHTNLVNFLGAVLDVEKTEIALVYEFLNGIELGLFVRTRGPPAKHVDSYCLMVDVCSALQYLHSQEPPILHGDLKSSNVMVEMLVSRPRAKMIDFGLSLFQTKGAKCVGFTRSWAAPEVFCKGKCPLPSSDVFSMGWLVHFVLTGQGPHGNLRGPPCSAAVKEMARTGFVKPLVWPIDAGFAKEVPELCDSCLRTKPLTRPTIADVRRMIAGWIIADQSCEAGFEICSTTLPTTTFRVAVQQLLSIAEDTNVEGKSCLHAKVSTGSAMKLQSLTLMRKEESVWEQIIHDNDEEDAAFWIQFEDAASIKVAIAAVVSDVYSCAAHAPSIMDFGVISLRIPEEIVPNTIFTDIGHRVRLKVSFPSITNVPRDECVATMQLWETNTHRKESL